MRLYYEWGARQFNKRGEELCGDSISVSRHPESVSVALSDGLGSGVKANILATLTIQIAMHLLDNGLPLGEVVQTLSETLPVCQVRGLAYSTFAIAQFHTRGDVRLVEFDTPPTILLRSRKPYPLLYDERPIQGKVIRESVADLECGDWMVFVSDGVLNAGIGGAYPLGWGWDQTASFVAERAHADLSAQDLADAVAFAAMDLYVGAPGDDVSVAVVKARHKLMATVLTGPPLHGGDDEMLVSRFIQHPGRHAVCGGTTAKIVARHMGQPLAVDLQTMTDTAPPVARLEGVDLVTEGILTLTLAREMLRDHTPRADLQYRTDGAAALVRLLLDVDHVQFLVGQTVNPAHQNPELPQQLELRLTVVREIAEELRKLGMEVNIESV